MTLSNEKVNVQVDNKIYYLDGTPLADLVTVIKMCPSHKTSSLKAEFDDNKGIDYQNPYIEDEQPTQWLKEILQKDK